MLKNPKTGELFVIEIKTGDDPTFTDNQIISYPIAGLGRHIYSRSTKSYTFGFYPGEILPPLTVLLVRAYPGKEIEVVPLSPELEKLLKFLSIFEKNPSLTEGMADG